MNRQSGNIGGYSRFTDDLDPEHSESEVLNKGEDDEYKCIGYRNHVGLLLLTATLVVLTGGLFLLVLYWRPDWRVKLLKVRCPLRLADAVVLVDTFGQSHSEAVVNTEINNGTSSVPILSVGDAYLQTEADQQPRLDDTTALNIHQRIFIRYFDHRHVRYMWDKNLKTFSKLKGLDRGLTCAIIHDQYGEGLGEAEQAYKIQLHGENTIVVAVKSYWRLFIEEVINPFYIFQICSIILWSLDDYFIYATCIFLISAVSLGIELYETRKQSVTLHDMVTSLETTMTVIRNNMEMEVPTTTLVPGDVIVIPPRGCVMNCDAVLLSGNAIVNESMLTGESVPVTKTPLSPSEAEEVYMPDTHKRHTLFCGTHIIQTRYYGDMLVKAVVVRTGFTTAKGELVRAILFPKPMGFQFYKDSIKFIGMLGIFAIIGMSYSTVVFINHETPIKEVILRALDIITIVVPPALPAAMTVGTVYAQSRLKKQGIFCISPPRINVCGKLKCICFDKTGTLTEEGLDMWGVIPIDHGSFQHAVQNVPELPAKGPFITAMATCHSLTRIEGEITGDPLDLKMFNSTNWILEEPGEDNTRFDQLIPTTVRPPLEAGRPFTFDPQLLMEPGKDSSKFETFVPTSVKPITREMYGDEMDEIPFEVGIVRQFTFSSNLQRMSVVTRTLGDNHMNVYAKGAPEKIVALCKKETVPEDFHDILQRYAIRGFRVIAVAWKPLLAKINWHQVQRVPREQIENELIFLGLLIMENMLKPETTPVIQELKQANIRTIMVTGDNILTAISVARQCDMVDSREPVIMVNAYPEELDQPARVDWGFADMDVVEEETPESQRSPPGERATEASQSSAGQLDPAKLYQSIMIDKEVKPRYHFAMTGRSFGVIRQDFPELLDKIVVRGTVFARMAPDQKTQLVEALQDLSYCVGMCGDGANDCGALKAAHAGISLSEAEASVASPFTSKKATIECVPTVIREGRAALVTSFGVFKYMALYSIIQFVSVLILYTKMANLGDWQFLYIDLVITTTVAVLMGHTAAYPHLVARRPQGSLVAPSTVFSILVNVILVAGFQAGIFMYMSAQPWFTPVDVPIGGENAVLCYETTIIFGVSSFQYIILAFCFSRGPPYRQPIWTNVWFLLALVILSAFTAYLIIYPAAFLAKVLQLQYIPSVTFRLTIVGLVAIHFFLAFLLETFIVPSQAFSSCMNKVRQKKGFKNKHKVVDQALKKQPDWPPVGDVTLAQPPYGNRAGVVVYQQR